MQPGGGEGAPELQVELDGTKLVLEEAGPAGPEGGSGRWGKASKGRGKVVAGDCVRGEGRSQGEAGGWAEGQDE